MKQPLFLLFSFIGFGASMPFLTAQTLIKGTAQAFSGKEIGIFIYGDYITKSKISLESAKISEDGKFSFELPKSLLPLSVLAIFKIENFAATMYIEPELKYEISIQKPDSIKFPDDRINYIGLEIVSPADELNALIKNFTAQYDDFVQKNYALFLRKAAKHQADSFKVSITRQFEKSGNSYFKDFVACNLASLDLILTSRNNVYEDYFAAMPVRYENDAYMALFNEFYDKQIDSFTETHLRELLISAINGQKSFESAMTVLSKEKLLGNETLRELVLMKILYNEYNNKELDRKSIRQILQELATKSNQPQHREIAMNILEKTGRLAIGSKAPEFSLYDRNNKPVSLSDFKGKYVYLDFWATWCNPCLKEMPEMEALYNKYGKEIAFISISIDKEEKTMQKFLQKKKACEWTFLHYGKNPSVKELYNVLAIPVYYLIDPDGFIIQSPAYRPGEKIEETFISIISGKRTKRKLRDWE